MIFYDTLLETSEISFLPLPDVEGLRSWSLPPSAVRSVRRRHTHTHTDVPATGSRKQAEEEEETAGAAEEEKADQPAG